MLFYGDVLAIQIRQQRAQIDPSQAIAQFQQARAAWSSPHQQAEIDYRIWQIDPTQEAARLNAADQYRVLYATSPQHEYRRRCQELTGDQLPDPPPVPDPPQIVYQYQEELPTILQRIERLLAQAR